MSGDTIITLIGNITADPELRYTSAVVPVANFTIATTPRIFDKNSNDWKDGETMFIRCQAWRETAENVVESLIKGSAVIAQGRLVSKSWEKDGEKRTTLELVVDEIGPSLRRAVAKPVKTQGVQQGQGAARGPGPVNAPWAGGRVDNEAPPF